METFEREKVNIWRELNENDPTIGWRVGFGQGIKDCGEFYWKYKNFIDF